MAHRGFRLTSEPHNDTRDAATDAYADLPLRVDVAVLAATTTPTGIALGLALVEPLPLARAICAVVVAVGLVLITAWLATFPRW